MSDFKLLTEHTEGVKYHEWVDVGTGYTYRDRLGRKGATTTRWNIMRCNNYDCAGQVMYRASLIDDLAAAWEADRTGSWTLDPAAVQS